MVSITTLLAIICMFLGTCHVNHAFVPGRVVTFRSANCVAPAKPRYNNNQRLQMPTMLLHMTDENKDPTAANPKISKDGTFYDDEVSPMMGMNWL